MKNIIKIGDSLKDFHDLILDLKMDLKEKLLKTKRNKVNDIIINDFHIIYIPNDKSKYMGIRNIDYLMCRDKDICNYLICRNLNIILIESYNELLKLICEE